MATPLVFGNSHSDGTLPDLLEKGGDLATLRDILGHANVVTPPRYLHSNAARMQGMVEEL